MLDTNDKRVTEITVQEFREIIRDVLRDLLSTEFASTNPVYSIEDEPLDDFPVDALILLNPTMTFSREELYGDDGR